MKFDLNGGYNLTLTAASYPPVYKGTTAGNFNLDFTVTRAGWDVGTLTTTNVTIINGVVINEGDSPIDKFYVLKLTADEFVLSMNRPSQTWDWGEATFWMFKPKP